MIVPMLEAHLIFLVLETHLIVVRYATKLIFIYWPWLTHDFLFPIEGQSEKGVGSLKWHLAVVGPKLQLEVGCLGDTMFCTGLDGILSIIYPYFLTPIHLLVVRGCTF